jgi:hypothetical protein
LEARIDSPVDDGPHSPAGSSERPVEKSDLPMAQDSVCVTRVEFSKKIVEKEPGRDDFVGDFWQGREKSSPVRHAKKGTRWTRGAEASGSTPASAANYVHFGIEAFLEPRAILE